MHTTHTIPDHARRFLLRGLVAGLLLSQSAFMAFAQTASTTESEKKELKKDELVVLEEFKVTAGFAGSLAASAEKKQAATVITEVISAEDIGKLPDISIADSLTRLSGLTTQRLNGRAQAIVIRGMNGDFSTGLLNGRQQVSTNSGRAVEFDQYPAELLNSVVVYKTTEASLVGQGLAGTVDLQTIRPLSVGGQRIVANAFYEWTGMDSNNAGADNAGHRETFSYIDQFDNGKVGVAIGISLSDRPGQGEQFNAWGYDGSFAGNSLLGGAKPFVRTSQIKRNGIMTVLEFAPHENFHSTVDLYVSDFVETQLLRGIEMPLSPNWGTYTTLAPGYTAVNGLITKATLNNFFGVVRNDFVKRDANLFAGGWNMSFGNDNGWKTEIDLSYSKVKRDDFVLETYSGFGVNGVGTPDTIGYTLSPNGSAGAVFTKVRDYSTGLRLGMPQGWGMSGTRPFGQHGFLKGPLSEDQIGQYGIKTTKALEGFFKRFEVGVTYNTRDKFERESGPDGMEGYFLQLKNGAASAPMPPSVGLTDLSFIGMGKMYSYDPLALYNSGFYDKIANNDPARRAANYDISEKIWTGYAKLDFATKLGNIPVKGNIGTQVIHSTQSSRGTSVSNNNGAITVNVVGEHSYTDVVPTLNVNFELNEQQILRLSVARQLARQPMNDMRAGNNYGFDSAKSGSTDPLNSPWSASGGNPKLEPWRANSIDLSFEHYFKDNMGYFALSAFNKDLVSYTYTKNTLVSFAGYPTGTVGTPAIFTGFNSVPSNGQGGYVRGLEFALSLPGEKLTPALKGFGFIGSTSFFKSSIQPDLGNPSTPLVGLSDRVMSGTVYYERHGFSARLSGRYRSDYRGDIATFGPRGAVYRNLQPETVYDAQVSYAFSKNSALKGLQLIAQVYNLTNEPLVATSGADIRYIQDFQEYGPSYSIGASYKF
ncbi:MAG: TonB-dependent receptor [Candidatus Didemnitutus sp.]|nr:TonB-dependent receptor [Candidatus Didemnitutus sp.]